VVAAFVFLDWEGVTAVLTVCELVLVALFMAVRIKAYSEEQRYR